MAKYGWAQALSAPLALAIAVALLVAVPAQALALDFSPPKSAEPAWTVETPELTGARGETVTLKVKAGVPDGWVIYSANPPKAKFAPFTKFTAPKDAPVSVGAPVKHAEEPHVKHEEVFGGDVEYFEKQAVFLVPVRIDPAPRQARRKPRSSPPARSAKRASACPSAMCRWRSRSWSAMRLR